MNDWNENKLGLRQASMMVGMHEQMLRRYIREGLFGGTEIVKNKKKYFVFKTELEMIKRIRLYMKHIPGASIEGIRDWFDIRSDAESNKTGVGSFEEKVLKRLDMLLERDHKLVIENEKLKEWAQRAAKEIERLRKKCGEE